MPGLPDAAGQSLPRPAIFAPPHNLCPAPQALNTCPNTLCYEAGSGLGRGASELGEALGDALPEAQRPWERRPGVLGLQNQGRQGRLSTQGWGHALGL